MLQKLLLKCLEQKHIMTARTYGIWSVIDLEGKKWKFMSDGSIYTQRKVYGRIVDAGGEYSTEMVSPKLSYDEMGSYRK